MYTVIFSYLQTQYLSYIDGTRLRRNALFTIDNNDTYKLFELNVKFEHSRLFLLHYLSLYL